MATAVGVRQYYRDENKAVALPFCPGCGNGIISGLTLRAVEELGLKMDDMIFGAGIGCAGSQLSTAFKADIIHSLHGRPIAFATGAKLVNPKMNVVVMSGDGDIGDIGGNHLIHAARRNIDMTVIVSNNFCYGMTGGQVCSTTPLGAATMTTRGGNPYQPFNLTKLVTAAGAVYAARFTVLQPFLLLKAIKTAISTKGFCFVEAVSTCHVQYGRRNKMDRVADMIQFIQKNTVTISAASKMSAEELKDKIITGVFTDERN